MILAIQACSPSVMEEHERTCSKNKRVIIHDAALWHEYRSEVEATHERELHAIPPIKWRTLYTGAGPFTIAFGKNKNFSRPKIKDGVVVRNDVFIMKGTMVVAQIVDFIATTRSIDGYTGFTCLKSYNDLVIGDADE